MDRKANQDPSQSRPKPVASAGLYSSGAAAASTPSAASNVSLNAPTTARGSQEAVGSEFGPPASGTTPVSRTAVLLTQHENTAASMQLPPSSQRMIPGSGSGSQGPPLMTGPSAIQQTMPHATRPTGAVTPVNEQRIVTGYAR